MKAGRVKKALAIRIAHELGEGFTCDPERLYVNRGSNEFNDWCSWSGHAINPVGLPILVCSWQPMGELIRCEKWTFIDGEIRGGF
jgi:hypothetical protein